MSHVKPLAAALSFALVLGCGGSGADTAPPGPGVSNSITIADNSYTPNAVVVPVGTTVTWTWTGVRPHDVQFNDGTHSIQMTGSGTYARQFTAPGTYDYHCNVHGLAMSGKVTVQ